MLFQRTLLHSSLLHWRNVYDAIRVGRILDDDCLKETMQSWIAHFATPEDREELRHYLLHFRKPMTVGSSQLQYAMETLNEMIE